jgi:hypothetical protein
MRKMLSAALLLCIVALLSVLLIPTVLATKPTHVSGTLYYVPAIVDHRWAGRNLHLDTTEETDWTGGLVGHSYDEPCRVVIHGANTFPATDWDSRWYTAIATFEEGECTVAGRTGGLVMRLVGKSGEPGEDWFGQWVIISGTGELAGIHGQGTWGGLGFIGAGPGEIWYSGQIHFKPD